MAKRIQDFGNFNSSNKDVTSTEIKVEVASKPKQKEIVKSTKPKIKKEKKVKEKSQTSSGNKLLTTLFVLLIIIGIAITRSKRKDFKMELNKLVEYLGGKDNLLDYEFHKSRFIVNVKDVNKVNKEGIQKLGAQGIVEIENQLKIILGPDATHLKKYIDDLK